jgi:hypothetical protein
MPEDLDKPVTTFPHGKTPPIDDMLDGKSLYQWPDQFGQVISYIHATLYEDYLKHDVNSLRQQNRHRWASIIAIGAGTIAIELSLIGVFLEAKGIDLGINFSRDFSGTFRIFELSAFTIAIGVVVIALLYKHWHENWLEERFCAEEYRTQKFRALLKNFLFCSGEKSWNERYSLWKAWLDEQVNTLKNRSKKSIRQCTEEGNFSPPLPGISQCSFDETYLENMVMYYMHKRLETQINYFDSRSEKLEGQDDRSRRILKWGFIFGIIFVFLQLIIDYTILKSYTVFHFFDISILLIMISLPILAFAVRTLRSSTEVARNASLYRANRNALENYRYRLVTKMGENVRNWEVIVKIIWDCENHLENVNREWLRIMIESEWFV